MAKMNRGRMPDYPNIYITGTRSAYAPEDIRDTMTVGDLIGYLEGFDEDSLVFIQNDNGYTFGEITDESIYAPEIEEDEYLDNLRSNFEDDDEDDEEYFGESMVRSPYPKNFSKLIERRKNRK